MNRCSLQQLFVHLVARVVTRQKYCLAACVDGLLCRQPRQGETLARLIAPREPNILAMSTPPHPKGRPVWLAMY